MQYGTVHNMTLTHACIHTYCTTLLNIVYNTCTHTLYSTYVYTDNHYYTQVCTYIHTYCTVHTYTQTITIIHKYAHTYTPSIHACKRIHTVFTHCSHMHARCTCAVLVNTLTITSWTVVPVGRAASSLHHTLDSGHARQCVLIVTCYVSRFVDWNMAGRYGLTISDGYLMTISCWDGRKGETELKWDQGTANLKANLVHQLPQLNKRQ